ncbi:uncharacterized protein LOC112351462 [Selaginella moellendorffii]|uniref:uncharacterized protein LOC112351462 n=1 Tax=Selaginella moellendorffii TaxID=88036 RepID=UPI000D1C491C|nr:uncharacterized protein LOC112351462 [Selaginella moellendorffii]|eukprot:XP_024545188.1 uncharacterized protein LOC112351462 [Selaginella moellendorffii]
MSSPPPGMRQASSSSASPSVPMALPSAASNACDSSGAGAGGIRSQIHVDGNLGALCEHIQAQGWNSRAFSDIVVHAMGSTFYLHRLLLSRSSFFRNMLQGPWKEASATEVKLQIDDENVNAEAVATALSYLYGHQPRLDDGNAFRVLAAASFLDLQDLCAFCTDFIISELWTENFLSYQAFAETQDYGIHGERVQKACWGYLCRGAAVELREILPKLSAQTLRTLLTSDELWVPSEEKRFELALSVLIARGVVTEIDSSSISDELSETGLGDTSSDVYVMPLRTEETGGSYQAEAHQNNEGDVVQAIQSIILEMVDTATTAKEQVTRGSSLGLEANITGRMEAAREEFWKGGGGECSSSTKSSSHNWARPSPSWGGRLVGRKSMKAYPNSDWTNNDEWETFISVFESGGIHYCHMPFEDLLDSRARLEELGFPCKSVADGLWLQTLLRQQVLSVAADTCKLCSVSLALCQCRQSYVYPPHGRISTPIPYREEQDKSQVLGIHPLPENQNLPAASNGQARVHVRGGMDGLAGIGRNGTTWPPARIMFSRVPFPGPHRGNQQQQLIANDQAVDYTAMDLPTYSVDGLNMVVGLSQGMSSVPVQSDNNGRPEDQTLQRSVTGESVNSEKLDVQLASREIGQGSSTISLDLRTPLRSFPPFRFGVEFDDVQRLTDGQSKHSPEVFYAGSLWKVSVQAFNDEDPRCRRTLGLFLHRRKADDSGPFRKVSLYIDTREKVTARYQLICPAKRGVMTLGSLTQGGTLLPKAPKGWGWRTAFLFDELVDLLQGNTFRVSAVVQVVASQYV